MVTGSSLCPKHARHLILSQAINKETQEPLTLLRLFLSFSSAPKTEQRFVSVALVAGT